MKKGIIIPVYNHGKACITVVQQLSSFNIPIILIDDGNKKDTKDCIEQIKNTYPELITVITLPVNCGKGEAVKQGIIESFRQNITNVLQIDADGQHDTSAVPYFFAQADLSPDTLICGYPEYDETVPSHRKNGRKFANAWCSAVTWKSGIKDSLCGFRIYPVQKTYDFVSKHHFDRRMGFDIEILVRLIWRRTPFKFYPVKVTYPQDGISNFDVVKDNIRISWVFTKLCTLMILQSPLFAFYKLMDLIKDLI